MSSNNKTQIKFSKQLEEFKNTEVKCDTHLEAIIYFLKYKFYPNVDIDNVSKYLTIELKQRILMECNQKRLINDEVVEKIKEALF